MKVVKVMKKNDDAIQKLFDDYAEDLGERVDLAERAKAALAAKNAATDVNKAKQQRKPNFWSWLAPICAVLIIVVVSFGVLAPLGIFGDGGKLSDGDQVAGNEQVDSSVSNIEYYAASDVKGRSVAYKDCDGTLKISQIKADADYTVVSERYYAFYFEDGTLAYIKAVLGVRSDEGFCEITIIAEVDGLLRNDLSDRYGKFISGRDVEIMVTLPDDKGEYVTNAYFSARGSHFYVYAMTGANSTLAEKIISKIL